MTINQREVFLDKAFVMTDGEGNTSIQFILAPSDPPRAETIPAVHQGVAGETLSDGTFVPDPPRAEAGPGTVQGTDDLVRKRVRWFGPDDDDTKDPDIDLTTNEGWREFAATLAEVDAPAKNVQSSLVNLVSAIHNHLAREAVRPALKAVQAFKQGPGPTARRGWNALAQDLLSIPSGDYPTGMARHEADIMHNAIMNFAHVIESLFSPGKPQAAPLSTEPNPAGRASASAIEAVIQGAGPGETGIPDRDRFMARLNELANVLAELEIPKFEGIRDAMHMLVDTSRKMFVDDIRRFTGAIPAEKSEKGSETKAAPYDPAAEAYRDEHATMFPEAGNPDMAPDDIAGKDEPTTTRVGNAEFNLDPIVPEAVANLIASIKMDYIDLDSVEWDAQAGAIVLKEHDKAIEFGIGKYRRPEAPETDTALRKALDDAGFFQCPF